MIRYYTGHSPGDPAVLAELAAAGCGLMAQPRSYSADVIARWPVWAADNGCFAAAWAPDVWLRWLRAVEHIPGRAFSVVPDVVGDHAATRAMWETWHELVTPPRAFVAQDGCTVDGVPWATLDVVFIGGSTGWKLGPAARLIVDEAVRRSVPVHMGRVNSETRLRMAQEWGVASADGTFLAFAPDANRRRLLRWLRACANISRAQQLDVQP